MGELLKRLADRPVLLAELLVASLLINILGLASTAFVMLVLGRYVPYGVNATLVTLTTGVALAALLAFGFREARRRLAADALDGGQPDRAGSAFAALTGIRSAVLDRLPVAARMETMRGIDAVDRAVNPANLSALLDVPFSAVTLLALFVLSPLLGLIALLCMTLSVTLTLLGERWTRNRLHGVVTAESAVQSLVASTASGADTARAFNAAGWLQSRWSRLRTAATDSRDAIAAGQGFVGSATQFLTALQGIAIIAVGAVLCVKGELNTAQLIGANILAGRALGPINRLVQLIEPLAKATLALNRLAEFARLPREQVSGTAIRDYAGRLEMTDLAFAYPGATTPLAEHLSLSLTPGAILAVTGPNGSGKTTFARLLLGLTDPLRGQVLADGVDMRQISVEWWRRQVCYLPQEPDFIDGSVADNLRLANPDLDEDGLHRIVAAAGLKSWLDGTAKGRDTPLAEGGRHLPPGIRRRLGLARALATGGRLCVFDDPTEGLDAEGQAAVYATLGQLAREGRTLVVCGNDPTIVRGAQLMLDLGCKPVPRLIAAPAEKGPADA
jgi:ATP-binding cassette subfamily C protein LapB